MFRILAGLAIILLVLVAFGFLSSEKTSGKGPVRIQSSEFLVPPEGLRGNFLVASRAPGVETLVFEGLQQGEDFLWSSWGDGCLASNGKYYTAIGDHRGYDGNSFVYEYDPKSRKLKLIVDIAKTIGQKSGNYGHGKIHAPIQEYRGALYFTTYWGKQKEVEQAFSTGYKGSLFFRYEFRKGRLQDLGVIAPRKGLPGSILDRRRELLYFYAVEGEKGDVLVYDLKNERVKFQGGAEYTTDYRAFLLARDGKAYFSDAAGKLSFYDPDKNAIQATTLVLPGPDNRLRASAASTQSGVIYGMTRAGRLFAFQPATRTIKDLGPNFLSGQYNAVMVLSPDEKYLYFAPGSHGSAAKIGTPVVQYEIKTGGRKVIAFLQQPLIKKIGYYIAGNYNMQIDPKGSVLYCTFNGSKFQKGKDQEEFGLPAIVIIQIPAKERK